MVTGLETFRAHFDDFIDQYLIIGGTACDLALTDAGLTFRATKDLDIVLCLESVDTGFGEAFWSFVRAGEYQSLEAAADGPRFHRFTRPRTDGYPVTLELFSRLPDLFGAGIKGHLTPIPMNDDVASLSAILLDDDYYEWARAGRTMINGLPVVRPEHLIPLKAKAWLDLTARAAEGRRVDSRDIRKHRNDVFRLYAIVDPDYLAMPATSIEADMRQFVERMRDEAIDPKAVGLGRITIDSALDALAVRYLDTTR